MRKNRNVIHLLIMAFVLMSISGYLLAQDGETETPEPTGAPARDEEEEDDEESDDDSEGEEGEGDGDDEDDDNDGDIAGAAGNAIVFWLPGGHEIVQEGRERLQNIFDVVLGAHALTKAKEKKSKSAEEAKAIQTAKKALARAKKNKPVTDDAAAYVQLC